MQETGVLEIRGMVDEILNRWPAVGLAVGVVRDGAPEFFSGHGLANIESAAPVTEDTVFRIASITKTFTATAIMQLRDAGKLDLDDRAVEHIPELAAASGTPASPAARLAASVGSASSNVRTAPPNRTV